MTSPITPDTAVYGIKALTSPMVAPDGSAIVYVVSQADRSTGQVVANLWLCDLDGSNQRQISRAGASNSGPAWSPDGASLAYVSRRDGDHPGAIVVLPLHGGESRIVTRHAAMPSALAWSPDGSAIAYTVEFDPDNPEETPLPPEAAPPVIVIDRLDYKHDGRGVHNRARQQVFVVDVATGERRRLTDEEVAYETPRWSPDGRTIACIGGKPDSPDTAIVLLDAATGEQRPGSGTSHPALDLWWLPDSSGLLYLGAPGRTPHPDYYRLDATTGESHPVTVDNPFLPDIGYQNASPPGMPIWLDARTAIVHGLLRGRSGLWQLDLATGATQELVRWDALHGGLSATPDHRLIAQAAASLAGNGDLVTWDRETGETRTIAAVNEACFQASPTADYETLSLQRAGMEIDAWLLRPAGFDPQQRYPLVLTVHGGPHNAYGYTFDVTAQVLATNGYLVLMVNPRGSGTAGRAFAEAVHGDWGGEDWHDLLAMLDLACEREYVDQDRLGIYGYSYGGYMTAWAIGQTDRFAAAICGAPVYDLLSFIGTSDVGYYFVPDQLRADPVTDRDHLIERSPATWAHRARTPTLIVQGDADERCPAGQAEQMFVDLRRNGCEAQLVRYPGGSHLMQRLSPAAHRVDYLERALAWFDGHLQGSR